MSTIEQVRTDRNRAMDRLRKRRLILAQLNGEPTSLVDAAPIRQRLVELTNLGYSYEAIAATYGTGTAAGLRLIALGTHQRAGRKFEGIARMKVTLNVSERVDDACWVPTLGAQRRLRALMRLGWRHEDVEALVGRSTHVLVGNSAPERIRAIDWRLIDAAWRTLSATPGPSVRSRARATRSGYAAPLDWDDIDNPHETPANINGRPTYRAAELAAEWDHLRRAGESIDQAARQLGVTVGAIEKALERVGKVSAA